jgi:nitrite reductase/ring-hydroxylating ferredoxin subunit
MATSISQAYVSSPAKQASFSMRDGEIIYTPSIPRNLTIEQELLLKCTALMTNVIHCVEEMGKEIFSGLKTPVQHGW